jgi:mono/diheme cytochrome c family protein
MSFGAAVLALACSSEDSNNQPAPQTVDVPAVDPCENPLNLSCAQNVPPAQDPVVNNPAGGGGSSGGANTTRSQEELDKAAAENVLASNCGYCHGPNLTPQQAKAGMNFIDDIDKLVETGKILPRNSAGSKVVQRMVRGDMPPPGSGYPTVKKSDVDIVAAYIDNPRYWAGVADANCRDEAPLVSFDDLYQDINADLAGEDANDREFLRYISISNRLTAGVCGDSLEMDKERQGMVKMLNMLSIKAVIGKVASANDSETLYRIDLRDFDWNRQITVNGTAFADVWEAIADANPYAVEFVGDDADDAKEDTATDFPLMFNDQMMDVAIIGNLYYAIVDIDVTQPFATFVSDKLGINVAENIENEEAIRAGTTRSIISRQDRLVERHDIGVRDGVFWQSFDFANDANDSIFEDPFGFVAGGTESIFTLPNGMLAYTIADAAGNLVQDSDILFDNSLNDFKAVTAVSCSNCHATGFIEVVDEVGPVAKATARQIGLNNDEVKQLEALYVSPDAFARKIKEDSEGFFQRALQRADLPVQGGDPVFRVFQRFDGRMELQDAAGDLGVKIEDLRDDLDLLNPVLAVLERSTLDRDDFTNKFVESLCILSDPNENIPDPAICDLLVP